MKPILTLTAVALLGTTSLVAAQETTAVNAFALPQTQASDGVIEFDLVTAEADGVVEIYAANDSAMATLLGSQPVTAGANEDVMVSLSAPAPSAESDLMAVLKIADVIVAEQLVDIEDGAGDGDDDPAGEGEPTEPEDQGEGGDGAEGGEDAEGGEGAEGSEGGEDAEGGEGGEGGEGSDG